MAVAGVGPISLITCLEVVSRLKVESYPSLRVWTYLAQGRWFRQGQRAGTFYLGGSAMRWATRAGTHHRDHV
jgi:hypothetical protein